MWLLQLLFLFWCVVPDTMKMRISWFVVIKVKQIITGQTKSTKGKMAVFSLKCLHVQHLLDREAEDQFFLLQAHTKIKSLWVLFLEKQTSFGSAGLLLLLEKEILTVSFPSRQLFAVTLTGFFLNLELFSAVMQPTCSWVLIHSKPSSIFPNFWSENIFFFHQRILKNRIWNCKRSPSPNSLYRGLWIPPNFTHLENNEACKTPVNSTYEWLQQSRQVK